MPAPQTRLAPGGGAVNRTARSVGTGSPAGIPGETIAAVLGGAGSTPREDLLRLVARELGFQRLGHRIRDGIDRALRTGAVERGRRAAGAGRNRLDGPTTDLRAAGEATALVPACFGA